MIQIISEQRFPLTLLPIQDGVKIRLEQNKIGAWALNLVHRTFLESYLEYNE